MFLLQGTSGEETNGRGREENGRSKRERLSKLN
jgi:hypothetical protein